MYPMEIINEDPFGSVCPTITVRPRESFETNSSKSQRQLCAFKPNRGGNKVQRVRVWIPSNDEKKERLLERKKRTLKKQDIFKDKGTSNQHDFDNNSKRTAKMKIELYRCHNGKYESVLHYPISIYTDTDIKEVFNFDAYLKPGMRFMEDDMLVLERQYLDVQNLDFASHVSFEI